MRSWFLVLFLGFASNAFAAFTFTSPLLRQIYQRTPASIGSFYILGPTTGVTAEARANPIGGYSGTDTGFVAIPVHSGFVDGYLPAAAGWYSLEVKTYDGGHVLVDDVTLAKVGIGDIYVTAGQSNAANYYSPFHTSSPNDAVNARSASVTWQQANDPQPGPDNTLSSVWPTLGNLLFADTTFPVGFVSVGQGNTTVSQWAPGTADYLLLKAAVKLFPKFGFRMFLWHQGENDASFGTTQASYFNSLQSIIERGRSDAGWDFPCGIANSVTHPNEATGAGTAAGQNQAATTIRGCFSGANTDTLDNTYRYDTVHFQTTTGQAAHAQLWHDAIVAQPFATGSAPIVVDSTDAKLCFYVGTWKCVQGL